MPPTELPGNKERVLDGGVVEVEVVVVSVAQRHLCIACVSRSITG